MLVGDSVRYVKGILKEIYPLWYNNQQLRTLGKVIPGICDLMKQDYPAVDLAKCSTPGVSGGVQFQNKGQSETYQ